ncbi:MAG: hypothetical protein CO020_01325 [Candidatus Colwellbacteria bacterium CG_4_9_14_0_2_um_filter_50_12]|uniref:Uncharacterized protein n=1 Tax=Candidatus Colwellbacteria bacterium CG_4_9_14_0_2_um_filter_50_12 TaxID=1974538 RepID=A0A2M8G108_9BACT|nr:MAG: hypothetical protein CO020_01325 [Candidatus Colwellbacteria bacterium CG_4_9_14_0_2_um_filter_50_12]
MTKRRFGKSEIWMFVGAALTLAITVAAVVLSLGFVSTNLYRALSPGENAEAAVHFDIAGYNALGLQ